MAVVYTVCTTDTSTAPSPNAWWLRYALPFSWSPIVDSDGYYLPEPRVEHYVSFPRWLIWFVWARWIAPTKIGIVPPLKDDKAIGKPRPIQLQSSYG